MSEMTNWRLGRHTSPMTDMPSTDDRFARLAAGLPAYRRERPRGQSEASFLYRIGTPEHLIGPVASDETVAGERAALIEFARRLRARSGRNPLERH